MAKTCSICKASKSETEFYKNSARKDGLCNWCKPCDNARQRKKYHRNIKRSREKRRLGQQKWRENNPGAEYEAHKRYVAKPEVHNRINQQSKDRRRKRREANPLPPRPAPTNEELAARQERKRERERERYQANKEQVKQKSREYSQSHKAERCAYRKKYAKENPELNRRWRRVACRNRRARMKGTHTAQDEQNQFEYQDGRCFYCATELGSYEDNSRWHVDHFVPLARGGTNDASNLVVACVKCNQDKHDKLYPHEWIPDL